MREVPITSTVGFEFMLTTSFFDSTAKGFSTHSLPKHAVKPYYASIKECHQLLMVNVASVESNFGGGQNTYLRLGLPPKQYDRIAHTPFFCLPDPVKRIHPSMGAALGVEVPPLITQGV